MNGEAVNINGGVEHVVTNGNGTNGSSLSSDDENVEESQRRPVNIEQDVREMERRKRVDAIMSSKIFREELERVVSDALLDASAANGTASAVSNISHLMSEMSLTHSAHNGGSSGAHSSGFLKGGVTGSCIVPINDIRGLEGMSYTKCEKDMRCRLAAAYRLVDFYGWTQSIYNHITLRLSQDNEHFLINPFGMLYSEVTASSLVKIDMQGNIVESGTTNFGVNVAGFTLHSAVHASRPDLKCIIHVHLPAIVAVSSSKCGLLRLSQESCIVGAVSYHTYEGLVVSLEERDRIASDLGVHNKILLLRNHGALCCGATVEEAFFYAYHLVLACETQLRMIPIGIDNLIQIDEETSKRVFQAAQKGGGGVNKVIANPDEGGEKRVGESGGKYQPHWSVGEMDFEAHMRILDNSGYRTGYTYRLPLVKDEITPKLKSDVQLPPSVSSLSYLLDEENLHKDGPLRLLLSAYSKQCNGNVSHNGGGGRSKWVNSPNVYQKVELMETGTNDPKKITKWVSDSPNKQQQIFSTSMKVDGSSQFVPLGTSKKEFKKIQQAMKDGRRAGGLTAGPESKVLTTDHDNLDASGCCVRAASAAAGATTNQRPVSPIVDGSDADFKFGAASKGIIQRDFQHHATVYNSPYAKNPFDNVSAEELEEYQRIVDSKSRPVSHNRTIDTDGEYTVSPTPDGGDDSTFNDTTVNDESTASVGEDENNSMNDALVVSVDDAATFDKKGGFVESIRVSTVKSAVTVKGSSSSRAASCHPPPTRSSMNDNTFTNGDDTDTGGGNRTLSDGETGDTRSPPPHNNTSGGKQKKKRSGLRTPSFLKRKKKDKKKEGRPPIPPSTADKSPNSTTTTSNNAVQVNGNYH